MFVMLNIKYRFTYGDADLSEFIKKCQDIMTTIAWKFYFPLWFPNNDSTNTKPLNLELLTELTSFIFISWF